jgi:hypothetical protein
MWFLKTLLRAGINVTKYFSYKTLLLFIYGRWGCAGLCRLFKKECKYSMIRHRSGFDRKKSGPVHATGAYLLLRSNFHYLPPSHQREVWPAQSEVASMRSQSMFSVFYRNLQISGRFYIPKTKNGGIWPMMWRCYGINSYELLGDVPFSLHLMLRWQEGGAEFILCYGLIARVRVHRHTKPCWRWCFFGAMMLLWIWQWWRFGVPSNLLLGGVGAWWRLI